jgi:hypothetical protein
MPYSPEAEAQMAEQAKRHRGQQFMRGEGPLLDSRFGARTIGVMAEITPGLEVWTDELDDMARHNHKGEALGGYVLSIDAGWSSVDQETGEMVNHPARFRCYDPQGRWPDRAFPVLSEDEVYRPGVRIPPAHHLVIALRRFCREVANHDSLNLDPFDAQLVIDAARLVTVLMGGR